MDISYSGSVLDVDGKSFIFPFDIGQVITDGEYVFVRLDLPMGKKTGMRPRISMESGMGRSYGRMRIRILFINMTIVPLKAYTLRTENWRHLIFTHSG